MGVQIHVPDLLRDQAAAGGPDDLGGVVQPVGGQALLLAVDHAPLRLAQGHGALERGAAGGLDALPFRLHQQAQEIIELGVGDGTLAGDEIGHDPGDKAGGAGAGQAVGLGLAGQSVVPDVGLFKFLCRHAQQDRGALGRLDKEAVDVVAIEPLEAIAHAARRPAHPGGDVDDEGVGLVHSNALFLQLSVQPLGGHGVAQEEGDGFLIVHKIAGGVGLGALPPLLHGAGVVVGILDDLHALAPQQVLLPLLRIGAHVDDDPEAQGGAHDADGEAQVARGAHLHGVAAQELLHVLIGKGGVVVLLGFPAARARSSACFKTS